jgi:hypothetical protein
MASAAANPLQPTYTSTPTGAATTYNPVGYNATTVANPYDPTQATDELTQAAQGQDQTQNKALASMLAAQGISPGSSAAQAAEQNLATTQAQALDPSLASAQQYAGGLNLQALLANQSALDTAGQFGAGAANTAGATNAASSNQMTLQNLLDTISTGQFNANAANTAGVDAAQLANNDWLAQLQGELGLQGQGLSTAGSLAGQQANQVVPTTPSFFSQLMGGLSGAASAAAPFMGSGTSAAGDGNPSGVTPGYYGRGGN